jgi:hypothetical protein
MKTLDLHRLHLNSPCKSRHSGAICTWFLWEKGFSSVARIKPNDYISFDCYLKRSILLTLLRLYILRKSIQSETDPPICSLISEHHWGRTSRRCFLIRGIWVRTECALPRIVTWYTVWNRAKCKLWRFRITLTCIFMLTSRCIARKYTYR